MSLPVLNTKRLCLRPFTTDDVSDLQRLVNNPEITSRTRQIPYPYTTSMAQEWITNQPQKYKTQEEAVFAITNLQNKQLIGCIALHFHLADARATLGYWIGIPFWSQGYATEAGQTVLQWGFQKASLNKVCAMHYASNPVSGRVMQKLGMTQEGVGVQHILKNNKFEDAVFYGLTAEQHARIIQR